MKNRAVVYSVSFSLLTLFAALAQPGSASWETIAVGTGAIAVPKGWRNLDGIQASTIVFRQGDGIIVPKLDETKAPLQIGLTVEKFPQSKESVKEIMDGLVEAAKKAPRLELVGKELIEDITLADGTAAKLLTVEFIKEGQRRSLQLKLVVQDSAGTAWIVTGFLVGGKDSAWPKAGSKYAKWLRAHVTSLDAKKFDSEKIKTAYADVAK